MSPPTHRPLGTRTLLGLLLAVCVIASIQFALPDDDTIGPVWLIPGIELVGIPIVLWIYRIAGPEHRVARLVMNSFLGFLVVASVLNAVLLLLSLLQGSSTSSGVALLLAGFGVLINNVLSFGIVYWWLDGGGPFRRGTDRAGTQDFLFPQQGIPDSTWQPSLMDYLFTAYTNIIAFSPTDTMPLSHRVKALFTLQSSTALVTIVVTLSRAINLIPGS